LNGPVGRALGEADCEKINQRKQEKAHEPEKASSKQRGRAPARATAIRSQSWSSGLNARTRGQSGEASRRRSVFEHSESAPSLSNLGRICLAFRNVGAEQRSLAAGMAVTPPDQGLEREPPIFAFRKGLHFPLYL